MTFQDALEEISAYCSEREEQAHEDGLPKEAKFWSESLYLIDQAAAKIDVLKLKSGVYIDPDDYGEWLESDE